MICSSIKMTLSPKLGSFYKRIISLGSYPWSPEVLLKLIHSPENIVVCQAHPALVKIGPVFVPSFIFNSPLARLHVLWIRELPACWRPRPSGM